MMLPQIVFASFWPLLCSASETPLSSSPAVPVTGIDHHPATTPPPVALPQYGLRKRQLSTGPDLCGVSSGPEVVRTHYCLTAGAICAATILPNSRAYQYCSYSQSATQIYYTTALASWDPNDACPTMARCCSNTVSPAPKFVLLTAGPYTVTAFDCGPEEGTWTFDAYTTFLNPAKFSVSLAQLGRTTKSISTPKGTALSPSNKSSPSSSSSPRNQSSPDHQRENTASKTKISIAVGVAAGVGIVVVGGITFFFWQRRHKRSVKQMIEGISSGMLNSSSHVDGHPRGSTMAQVSHPTPECYGELPSITDPQELHGRPVKLPELHCQPVMPQELHEETATLNTSSSVREQEL